MHGSPEPGPDGEKPCKAPAGKSSMTVAEAGKRGGEVTLRKRGTGFFSQIGRKGGRRTATLYGHLLGEWGSRGGRPRRPSLRDSVGE